MPLAMLMQAIKRGLYDTGTGLQEWAGEPIPVVYFDKPSPHVWLEIAGARTVYDIKLLRDLLVNM